VGEGCSWQFLLHLSNRVTIQSPLDLIQIETNQARRQFLKRNFLIVNPLIDGANTDIEFMSKLRFGNAAGTFG